VFFTDFFIKRPRLTTAAMLAIATVGVFALSRLEISASPAISRPSIQVAVTYPRPAEVIERQILSPIEDRILMIPVVQGVASTAHEGGLEMRVTLARGSSIDEATTDNRDPRNTLRPPR
jgi:multidrug efflux pump subunit AcrB